MKNKLLHLMCAIAVVAGIACASPSDAHAEEGPVAKIGATEYTSFESALAEWRAHGGTLTLLSNVEWSVFAPSEGTQRTSIDLPSGIDAGLDLNGFALSCETEAPAGSTLVFINVGSGGSLTVKDSKGGGLLAFTAEGDGYRTLIMSKGSLKIEGGTLASDGCTLFLDAGTNAEITGGAISNVIAGEERLQNAIEVLCGAQLKVSGETIVTSYNAGISAGGNGEGKAKVVVSGSPTISGDAKAIEIIANGEVSLEGGSYSGKHAVLWQRGSLTISGAIEMSGSQYDINIRNGESPMIIAGDLTGGPYSINASDSVVVFARGASGVSADKNDFASAKPGYAIEKNLGDNTLSLVECTHPGGLNSSGFCEECGGYVKYDVVVNGIQATSANASDILHNGTVSYNPTSNTLTLNNADIASSEIAAIIGVDLIVNLVGSNRVTSSSLVGMLIKGDCTIQGDGSLFVSGPTYGLFVEKTLSVLSQVEAFANGDDSAIYEVSAGVCAANISVSEDGSLAAKVQPCSDDESLYAAIIVQGGTFTNDGTVTLDGEVREIAFIDNGSGSCGASAISPHDEDNICLICGETHESAPEGDQPENPGSPDDPGNSDGPSSPGGSNDPGNSDGPSSPGGSNQPQNGTLTPTGDRSPATLLMLSALVAAFVLGCFAIARTLRTSTGGSAQG